VCARGGSGRESIAHLSETNRRLCTTTAATDDATIAVLDDVACERRYDPI
jgi:hypothetical protein